MVASAEVHDGTDLPSHLYRWLESGLLRVSREFDAASDPVVTGVGHRRLRILQLIPADGIRQTALAERALVTKQAITDLVDNLQADGLVTRASDPADGRAWVVVRTEAGDKVNEAADRAMAQVERTLADEVGEGRYATFLEVLRQFGGA